MEIHIDQKDLPNTCMKIVDIFKYKACYDPNQMQRLPNSGHFPGASIQCLHLDIFGVSADICWPFAQMATTYLGISLFTWRDTEWILAASPVNLPCGFNLVCTKWQSVCDKCAGVKMRTDISYDFSERAARICLLSFSKKEGWKA